MTIVKLDGDLSELRDAASRFIDAYRPLTQVRAELEGGTGPGLKYRRTAADLGWYGVAEDDSEQDEIALRVGVVIAELCGQNLQSTDYIHANVVAATLRRLGTHDATLTDITSGAIQTAWVFNQPAYSADRPLGLTAQRNGGGLVLDTATIPIPVMVTEKALLLVTTVADDGVHQHLIPLDTQGISVHPVEAFDLVSPLVEVRLEGVVLDPAAEIGEVETNCDVVRAQLDLAALLATCDSLGAAQALLDSTVEYAKARHTFGRPIGSYQAIKHMLADAALHIVGGQSAAAAAIHALIDDHPDSSEIVSIAKAYVSDHGFDIGQIAHQVHGGIGYAWEHDLHLFLRRLAANSTLFGDAAYHRDWIARHHD